MTTLTCVSKAFRGLVDDTTYDHPSSPRRSSGGSGTWTSLFFRRPSWTPPTSSPRGHDDDDDNDNDGKGRGGAEEDEKDETTGETTTRQRDDGVEDKTGVYGTATLIWWELWKRDYAWIVWDVGREALRRSLRTSLLRDTPWECPAIVLSFLTNRRLHSSSSSASEEDEEERRAFRTLFLHGDDHHHHHHGGRKSMKEFYFTFGRTWLGYTIAGRATYKCLVVDRLCIDIDDDEDEDDDDGDDDDNDHHSNGEMMTTTTTHRRHRRYRSSFREGTRWLKGGCGLVRPPPGGNTNHVEGRRTMTAEEDGDHDDDDMDASSSTSTSSLSQLVLKK